jgi:hypothetical protein
VIGFQYPRFIDNGSEAMKFAISMIAIRIPPV